MTTTLAAHGIVPVDKVGDEAMRVGFVSRTRHCRVVFRSVFIVRINGVDDVLLDCSIEKDGLLSDHRYPGMQILVGVILNLLPVDKNRATAGIVEALE